jgi:hypothetical protein
VGVFSFAAVLARALFPIRCMAEKHLRTYTGGVILILLDIHPEGD